MIFAEVIGDPIAQSKSPLIHLHWLERVGIEGDYLRTLVAKADLPCFFAQRRSNPDWRGCNVTVPHKQSIISLVDRLDAGAEAIGAINCVAPESGILVGYNTDVDGVEAALGSTELRGRTAALIGAGGGARAVVAYLARLGIGRIAILARNADRAEGLRDLAPNVQIEIHPFDRPSAALVGASLIINASPLGMTGADPMPQFLLGAVRSNARGATIFDLVTTPVETSFLAAGRLGGGDIVDGLTMLVGQAARAFKLFFGTTAPQPDEGLRDLLITRANFANWDTMKPI